MDELNIDRFTKSQMLVAIVCFTFVVTLTLVKFNVIPVALLIPESKVLINASDASLLETRCVTSFRCNNLMNYTFIKGPKTCIDLHRSTLRDLDCDSYTSSGCPLEAPLWFGNSCVEACPHGYAVSNFTDYGIVHEGCVLDWKLAKASLASMNISNAFVDERYVDIPNASICFVNPETGSCVRVRELAEKGFLGKPPQDSDFEKRDERWAQAFNTSNGEKTSIEIQ